MWPGPLSDLAGSEFIITMLADGDALEEVYAALAGNLDPQTVAIDMGTSGSGEFREGAGQVKARGDDDGDCPGLRSYGGRRGGLAAGDGGCL